MAKQINQLLLLLPEWPIVIVQTVKVGQISIGSREMANKTFEKICYHFILDKHIGSMQLVCM